jgi:hypothetical protein
MQRSAASSSVWVSPYLDGGERYSPRAIAAPSALWDGTELQLEVPVVHLRHHLPPEIRAYWQDDKFLLPIKTHHPYGNLPDLFLTYYLMVQYTSPQGSIYLNIGRIRGCLHRDSHRETSGDPQAKLAAKDVFVPKLKPGLTMIDGGSGLRQGADGRLYFRVKLDVMSDNSESSGVYKALQEARAQTANNQIAPYIAVTVERSGVYSKLASIGDKPECAPLSE